jgi:peptide/nickel transport system permease protein
VIRWLLRRSIDAIATAFIAVVLLVVLVHLLPGDPLAVIIGDHEVDPATRAALAASWGTDRPLYSAVGHYLLSLMQGDFGISMSENRPVSTVLLEHLGPTLLLGSLTLLIDFTLGLALGLWSALHPGSWRARLLSGLTVVGYALPSFVVGMVLVSLIALRLHWLPPAGLADQTLPLDASLGVTLLDRLAHLVLPLTTLVIATIAVPLRQQRAAVLQTLGQPWVLAARARGVTPSAIAWRHCWRPALTPIVTLAGLWLPMLVGGAVFVEMLFNWPGIGSVIAQATASRDTPLVLGAGVMLIAMVQLGSLLADVMYRVVDPTQRDQ